MNDKKFEKINNKIEIAYSNLPIYQMSVHLENFTFWDQNCQKNMNKKKFEKINAKVEIIIYNVPPYQISFNF